MRTAALTAVAARSVVWPVSIQGAWPVGETHCRSEGVAMSLCLVCVCVCVGVGVLVCVCVY